MSGAGSSNRRFSFADAACRAGPLPPGAQPYLFPSVSSSSHQLDRALNCSVRVTGMTMNRRQFHAALSRRFAPASHSINVRAGVRKSHRNHIP
jgi:hypothetical protein